MRLYSRNGHEWTKRLATLADALAGIPGRSAVIDAELCFLTGVGAPDFAGLQLALRSRHHHKLTVFAFDLLHRDGVDLCPLPLSQRKDLLATLVRRSKMDCLQLVATFPDGAKLLASAERYEARGHRVEAAGSRLPLGRVQRLAQDQDGGLARGEPGAVADVRTNLMKPAAMRICNAYPGLTATGIYGSTVGVPPIWHGERGKTMKRANA